MHPKPEDDEDDVVTVIAANIPNDEQGVAASRAPVAGGLAATGASGPADVASASNGHAESPRDGDVPTQNLIQLDA